MREVVAFLMLTWAAAAMAQAPDISVGAGIEASRRNLQAEQEVRERYVEFVDAFNKHDSAAMSALWTRQGDHYEPDGSFAEGREGVKRLFDAEHGGPFKNATIKLRIDTVWMITPNVALVNGFYEVDGIRDPTGKEVAIRKGHLTSVMLNENGKWWVAASRATVPVPVPWRQPPPD